MDFDKIVKKLSRNKHFVVSLSDVRDLVDPMGGRGESGLREAYKAVSNLKAAKVLFPIRNGLYFVTLGKTPSPKEEISMVEDTYWQIVRKMLASKGVEGIIAGPKAIEILLRDLSIPDILIVYTKDTNAVWNISDRHTLVLKTVKTGEKTGRGNAYPTFRKMSEVRDIGGVKFRLAGIEHAFLDALITHKGISKTVGEHSVKKAISKYSKALDREKLGKLVSYKYLTAINRLRTIARDMGETNLYEKTLDVVKFEGGNCFGSR